MKGHTKGGLKKSHKLTLRTDQKNLSPKTAKRGHKVGYFGKMA